MCSIIQSSSLVVLVGVFNLRFAVCFIGCPPNWYAANDETCYRNVFPVGTEQRTYEESERLCHVLDHRATLPKIHTVRDWSTLKEFAYLINHGELFKFWLKSDNKSQSASSNCEIAWGVENQRFNSVACGSKYDVICQLNVTLPMLEPQSYVCPAGWYVTQTGKCYLIPHRQLRTYSDAKKDCKNAHPDANIPLFGQNQMSIEFRQFYEEINGPLWPKAWMRTLSTVDSPVAGSYCPVTISATIPFASEPCVAVTSVVCEMDAVQNNQSFEGNNSCPAGWTLGSENICYRDPSSILGRKLRSYYDAVQDCSILHPQATLPEMESADDWANFAKTVKNFNNGGWPNLWMEGRRLSVEDNYHSGSGSDLSEIATNFWAASEPLAVSTFQCIRSTLDKGEWRATDCFTKLNVVCQLNLPVQIDRKLSCPLKWFTGRNHCYKIPYGIQKNREFSYAAAESVCSKHKIERQTAFLPNFEPAGYDEAQFFSFLKLVNGPIGWINAWLQNEDTKTATLCPATLNSEGRLHKPSCKTDNAVICQTKRLDEDLELQAPLSIEELIPETNVGSVCPSGWCSGKGKFCYRSLHNLDTKMMDYYAAEQKCSQLHSSATLPKFRNEEQWKGFEDFIYSRNNGKWAKTWVKSVDSEEDEPDTWTNFDGDNNMDSGRCSVTWNLDGRWKAVKCAPALHNGVCQLDANDLVDNGELRGSIEAESYKCPTGWYVASDGNCYIKPSTQLVTKLKAEELCRKLHSSARLPFFEDEKAWLSYREFIMSVNRKAWLHSWINGNDVDREGTWTEDKSRKHFNYTNWYSSEPNGGIVSNCLTAYVVEGQWSDESCGSLHYYTCQLSSEEYVKSKQSTQKNNGAKCPAGWIVGHDNTCFYAPFTLNVELKSHDDAVKACEEANPLATLPRISSQKEWLEMANILPSINLDVWAILWIDGKAEKLKKDFYFENGQEMKFNKWLPGQPVVQAIDTCVVATDRIGRWINLPCIGVQNVLCQLKVDDDVRGGHYHVQREIGVEKQLGICPFGWTFMEGICYRAPFPLASTYSFTKSEAVQLCGAELNSAHLPHFEDETEWRAFETFISRIDRGPWKRIWLGGSDELFEGRFVNDVSLDTLNYTNWNTRKPLGMKGLDCISTIGAKGQWTDTNCDAKMKVVCQVTQNEFLKELIATVTENQRRLTQTTTSSPVPIVSEDPATPTSSTVGMVSEDPGTPTSSTVGIVTDEPVTTSTEPAELSGNTEGEISGFSNEKSDPAEPDKTTEEHLSQERTFEESSELPSGFGQESIEPSEEDKDQKTAEVIEAGSGDQDTSEELSCTDDNGNLWNNGEVFFFGNLEVSCNIDAAAQTKDIKILQCCEEQAMHCISVGSKVVSSNRQNNWFYCNQKGGRYVEDLTLSQTSTTTPASTIEVGEGSKDPGCYDDLGQKRDVGDFFVYGTYVVECLEHNPLSSQPIKINSCCESETNLCTPLMSIAESLQYPGFYIQCRDSGSNYVNEPCTDDEGIVNTGNETMLIDNLKVRCETDEEFNESYFSVEECCEAGTNECTPLERKAESTKFKGYEYECTKRGFVYNVIET